MTWLVNHPGWLAALAATAGSVGREILAFFFEGLNAMFFSLAVFSELMRGF